MTDLAKVQKKKRKINVAGYLFILPAMLFFCLYILYPIFFIVKNSLLKWATLSNMEFVGLENFIKVFQDSTFWVTMKNSILWIVVTVPVQAILGFFLAYAIEERIKSKKADGKAFSRTFYRTLFFIPVVTSVTVVAIMFSKIFQPYQGIIGHYLNSWFGMSPTINVLGNSKAALWGIMLANIWEWTGWSMIMYIGGISQISEDVKEAARIDGANTWQEIIYVYIPALGSVHKSLLMLGIIGSLQTYALIGVMTGGGPNHATEMPGTYIFMKGFTESQMGYACAMALKNLMGLVCDPVAGLVEVPCVKRNVGGAVNALAAADMALAGIISQIPVDQVIDAMGEVGIKMDVSLRETSLGGVAVSPRGIEIAEKLGM